ncbi:hypothetical protein ACO0K7_11045 [Undibacterium sp. Ji67W]|uniref:hypothetical protein n=1 Tax=Undibacterium sp. Ji67W TaxID=3413042 RepID=UPI003BF3FE52
MLIACSVKEDGALLRQKVWRYFTRDELEMDVVVTFGMRHSAVIALCPGVAEEA